MNSIIPCEDCTSSHLTNRYATYGKFKLDEDGTIHFTFLDHDNTYDWRILMLRGSKNGPVAYDMTINQDTFASGITIDMTLGLYVLEVVANGADLQTGMLRLKLEDVTDVCNPSMYGGHKTVECAIDHPVTSTYSQMLTLSMDNTNKYTSRRNAFNANTHYSMYSTSKYIDLVSVDTTSTFHNGSFDTVGELDSVNLIATFEYDNTNDPTIQNDNVDINFKAFEHIVDHFIFTTATISDYIISHDVDGSYRTVTITPNNIQEYIVHYGIYCKIKPKYASTLSSYFIVDTIDEDVVSITCNLNVANDFVNNYIDDSKIADIVIYFENSYYNIICPNGTTEELIDNYLSGFELLISGYLTNSTFDLVDAYPERLPAERLNTVIELPENSTVSHTYDAENTYLSFKFNYHNGYTYTFEYDDMELSIIEVYDDSGYFINRVEGSFTVPEIDEVNPDEIDCDVTILFKYVGSDSITASTLLSVVAIG